jgi:hypothetical protein
VALPANPASTMRVLKPGGCVSEASA